MDYNPVAFELRPDDPGLSCDDGFDTGGDIFYRNVDMTCLAPGRSLSTSWLVAAVVLFHAALLQVPAQVL